MHIERAKEEIIQTINAGNPPVADVCSMVFATWLHQNASNGALRAMYKHAKSGVNMDNWLRDLIKQTNKELVV